MSNKRKGKVIFAVVDTDSTRIVDWSESEYIANRLRDAERQNNREVIVKRITVDANDPKYMR